MKFIDNSQTFCLRPQKKNFDKKKSIQCKSGFHISCLASILLCLLQENTFLGHCMIERINKRKT